MSIRDRLNQLVDEEDIFPELSDAEKNINSLMVSLSNEICKIRKHMGKNQAQFADYMDVSQSMVCKWESGQYNFTIESAIKILSRCGYKMELALRPMSSGIKAIENKLVGQYVGACVDKPCENVFDFAELLKAG